jgi:hypothetical protein
VGLRLFPVQLLESLWTFGIVCVDIVLVLGPWPPGTALAWHILAYGAGRFCFEFLRGDAARPYWLGFSEAQWTSFALMCAVLLVELAGLFSFRLWHAALVALVGLTMIAIGLWRRSRGAKVSQLLHPHHIEEVARIVRSRPGLALSGVSCTSLGIQISVGRIEQVAGTVRHYALSCKDGGMTETTASALAKLLCRLWPLGPSELIAGGQGVYHLLVYPQGVAGNIQQSPNRVNYARS